MKEYNIPFFQKSGFKWYMSILFVMCILTTIAFSVFFFLVEVKDDFGSALFLGSFMFILSIFFMYFFVTVGILKKFYIEITSEYIKYSTPFKVKTAYWGEIYETQIYEFNNNIMISILLKKDRSRKRKRTIFNNFDRLYGIPPNSFQISFGAFKDIDPNRLLLTIQNQINKDEFSNDILYESYEQQENSIIKAIAISCLFSIIVSSICGFTIYEFEQDYMIILYWGAF